MRWSGGGERSGVVDDCSTMADWFFRVRVETDADTIGGGGSNTCSGS
jgi:hypothetical protein